MRRNLTLLICVGFLAGLTNVASAIVWIGAGSWCDPPNWEGGVVPGCEDDAYIRCGAGRGDIIIDCNACVSQLHGPCYGDDDCNQTMGIVEGGNMVVHGDWRAIYSGCKHCSVIMTGGSFTVGGQVRLSDDGSDCTIGYYRFCGGVIDFRGVLRSGDNGGHVTIVWCGDVIASISGYMRIGDDGGGQMRFEDNASVTVGQELYFVCRKMSTDVQIHGNAEIYVEEDFRLGNPGQAAGKAPTSATMTMSGGTLNADRVRLGWDPYPDFIECTLDMSGGLIVARSDLQVGEKTTVSLTGGEIRIESGDSLEIDDGGNLDICDTGVLKIKGNVVDEIAVMVCDGSGRLTGCGSPAGVVIEYDGVYTVVTGTWDPNPDIPYCPVPPDGAERVRASLTGTFLCWQHGVCVGSRGRHIVYFSTDCDCVENAPPCDASVPCFWEVCRAGETCVDVGPLELWATYCWRVDSFCEDGRCVQGCVWSFTTGCVDIPGDCNRDCILDFKDYAATVDDFGEKIYWP